MKKIVDLFIILIVPLIIVASLVFNLSMVEKVGAVGTGSTDQCSSASNKDTNPNDNGSVTPFVYNFDAGVGKVVTGVCIKAGNLHTDLLGNGVYENGCYSIAGVGTQTLTVTRNLTGNSCQNLSHLDINVGNAPTITSAPTPTATPTPTNTPTPTPTSVPTPTPTNTPTPTLAVTPTNVPDERKVAICHATASATNPYEFIEVALSAADGGGDNGDHFNEHTGPIFNPLTNKSGDNWGDIIPPVEGVHDGLNWTAEGQALYRARCVFGVGGENPTATPTPGPTATPTPGPTATPTPGPTATPTPGTGVGGGSVQGTQTGDPLKGVLGLSTTSSGNNTNPYLMYVQLAGALFFSLEAYRRFAKVS